MRNQRKRFLTYAVIAAATALGLAGQAMAEQQPDPRQMMQKQIQIMDPALRQRVQQLSPETKQSLLRIYSQHSRHSDEVTLRQVMHEVLADYQKIASGIMTDNAEQAADAARSLANHRIPRGGLLPYLSIEDISDDKLGVLVPFNDDVEGNAKRLADAAERGEMAAAAEYFGKIAAGCVGCHSVFRGKPGVSPLLVSQ